MEEPRSKLRGIEPASSSANLRSRNNPKGARLPRSRTSGNRSEAEFDGVNARAGFNLCETAGQTIDHVHIHVIPRYEDDMEDP
ncbi:MAG: HIT family protein, partial [Bacteroidota bacterium]